MAEEAASRWAEMVIADAISAADRAAEDALSSTGADRDVCVVRRRSASRSPSKDHDWPLDPITESVVPEMATQPQPAPHPEPTAKEAGTHAYPCSNELPNHNDFMPDFRKARSVSADRPREQDCTKLSVQADLIEYRLSMLQLDIGQISSRIQQQSVGVAASVAATVCSHLDMELLKMRRINEQQLNQLSSLLRKAFNMELPFPVEEATSSNSIAALAAASLHPSKPNTVMPEPAQWDATHASSGVTADASHSCGRGPISAAAPLLRTREHQILHKTPCSSVQGDSRGLMSTSQSQSPCRFDRDHPSPVLHRRGCASASVSVDEGLNGSGSPPPPPLSVPHSKQWAGANKSWLTPRNASSIEKAHSAMSPWKSVPQHYRELPHELSGAADQYVTLERPARGAVLQVPQMCGSQSSRESRKARCVPTVVPPQVSPVSPVTPVTNQCHPSVGLPTSIGHVQPGKQGSSSLTCLPGHRRGVISVPLSREAPILRAEPLRRSQGGKSMAQWLAKARVDSTPHDVDVGISRRTSPRGRDGAQASSRAEWLDDSTSPVHSVQSREHSRASFAA